MSRIEKDFDINGILLKVFSSLESIRDAREIELIYDMSATIPKDLKGDEVVLSRILTKILTFVFQNTTQKEIVFSLHAPEDFLYEECISFKIKDTNIAKEKMLEYLEKNISKEIEILEGKILYDKDVDIFLSIPFQISELGHRRHYRLPDVGMLGKKVLIISRSENVTQSIKKMFMYFLYEVDTGIEQFKKKGSDLSQYDILVIDDEFSTDELKNIVAKLQRLMPFKYVILRNSHFIHMKRSGVVSAYLIKPVTQESIFELIFTLFYDDVNISDYTLEEAKFIVDLEKLLNNTEVQQEEPVATQNVTHDNFHYIIEKKKEVKDTILDTKLGEENVKKIGLIYSKELKKFLDTFDRSDIYFRQIVNEKSTNKIKEFCIDLEKQSKLIGAQSMLRFSEIISLIFVYDKLDLLPIYPGKYHVELRNLLQEIKKHLGMK